MCLAGHDRRRPGPRALPHFGRSPPTGIPVRDGWRGPGSAKLIVPHAIRRSLRRGAANREPSMSDHERGAYTPPTDAPLAFDARQPVRGARQMPFLLILSVLVLVALTGALMIFYRSGIRQAGQGPQAVVQPVAGIKAPPPAEAQPQDPAAGLQIYKTEGGKAPPPAAPQFTPPPEQPQARAEAASPKIVVPPAPPAAPAAASPTLRPSIPAEPPAAVAAAKAPAPK